MFKHYQTFLSCARAHHVLNNRCYTLLQKSLYLLKREVPKKKNPISTFIKEAELIVAHLCTMNEGYSRWVLLLETRSAQGVEESFCHATYHYVLNDLNNLEAFLSEQYQNLNVCQLKIQGCLSKRSASLYFNYFCSALEKTMALHQSYQMSLRDFEQLLNHKPIDPRTTPCGTLGSLLAYCKERLAVMNSVQVIQRRGQNR